MTVWTIVSGTLGVLALLSLWAGRRFARHDRLPMTWGIDGRPGWEAPRMVALAFTPLLGGAMLGLVALAPEQTGGLGQEEVLMLIGLALIIGHLYFLKKLSKWDRDQQ